MEIERYTLATGETAVAGFVRFWKPWGDLLHSVQTGEAAFPQVFSTELFPYLTQQPEAGAIFDEAMTGLSARSIAAVANAYDFSQFGAVVDVGGGHGTLLTCSLRFCE